MGVLELRPDSVIVDELVDVRLLGALAVGVFVAGIVFDKSGELVLVFV